MEFANKIVIILRDDLPTWQKLNVTAFLMSGISSTQNITGEPYADGDGITYLPMARQPVMIYAAEREQLKTTLKKALQKEVAMTIFTEEIFYTYNDEDNRAKVAEYKTDDLNLAGIGIIGKKNHVDRLTKGINLHT